MLQEECTLRIPNCFRSYLGITSHWLKKKDLTRISCLLAMKRLKGKHSFDVLAKSMESVYTEFDINHKITYSTTDNGFNFVKKFKIVIFFCSVKFI